MDDQGQTDQKPTLTLEEELDVLEAVYRVGQEKGLNLLRPEQEKKLRDAGRLQKNLNQTQTHTQEDNKISEVGADDLIIYALEDALVEVLIKKEFYTREEWEAKPEVLKIELLRVYAYAFLGIELEEWALKVRESARK